MGPFAPRNDDYEHKVRAIMEKAAFIRDLGIRVVRVAPGECETVLDVGPQHAQQNGYVHAGVLASMGDHTAGAATGSLVGAAESVLTIEFKINFFRPAKGSVIRCVARVVRQGRLISFVEAEMFARNGDDERLVAKSSVTLAVVADTML